MPAIIISGWLGDENQQVGVLGLGWVATIEATNNDITFPVPILSGTSAVVFTGAGTVTFPHLLLDGTGDEAFIGAGGLAFPAPLLSGSGDEKFSGTGSFTTSIFGLEGNGNIPPGPLTPIFVSSFDSATPLAPWTIGADATVVTGRNDFGAHPNHSGINELSASLSPLAGSIGIGAAMKLADFNGSLLCVNSNADGSQLSTELAHLGDGRLRLRGKCNFGPDQLVTIWQGTAAAGNSPFGLVCSTGEYFYLELGVIPVLQTFPPTDGNILHANYILDVTVWFRVNGFTLWIGGFGWNVINFPIASKPAVGASRFSLMGATNVIYDDVYVKDIPDDPISVSDSDFYGDIYAEADDLTVNIQPADPRATQLVQEATMYVAADPVFTQVLNENTMQKTVQPVFTQVLMEVTFKRLTGYISSKFTGHIIGT